MKSLALLFTIISLMNAINALLIPRAQFVERGPFLIPSMINPARRGISIFLEWKEGVEDQGDAE